MKHIFVLVFLVSTLHLNAQDVNPTQKGNLMLGGGGSISYYADFDETSTINVFSLSLRPSIGWFLSDGFALGIGPTFSITSFFLENWNTHLGIGTDVFVAKYWGSGIFIKGSTGYSLLHTFDSSDNSIHTLNLIPEVGYAFFLGPNLALELGLREILNIRLTGASTSYNSTTAVSVGFQIFL